MLGHSHHGVPTGGALSVFAGVGAVFTVLGSTVIVAGGGHEGTNDVDESEHGSIRRDFRKGPPQVPKTHRTKLIRYTAVHSDAR